MNRFLIYFLFSIPVLGWSQVGDLPNAKPLKIEAANKLNKDGKTDKGTALRIPDVIKEQPKINFKDSLTGRKPVQMIPKKKMLQAGHGMKIDPKIREGSTKHFKSINLGELTTTSRILKLNCRDFGEIDGDIVRIKLNDNIVVRKLLLEGASKFVEVRLEDGYNTLEFIAISPGYAPPATSIFKVIDEASLLIYTGQWWLSKGEIGTFTIKKVDEKPTLPEE